MSKEEWKDADGYEGLYQVSNMGRIMRVAGGQGAQAGRILKPILNRHTGYLHVGLYRDGKRTYLYVHRLVATAFLGVQLSPNHEINHKNGNRADNRVENLEWITRSENHKHAYRVLGREAAPSRGEAHGGSKLTRRDVRQIRKLYKTGDHTQADLAEMFGVAKPTIGHITRRETWKHVA